MNNEQHTNYYGNPFPGSQKAIIMMHGRGSHGDIIAQFLSEELPLDNFYIAAPNASHFNSWYPESFMAPLEQNEPWLSRSLDQLNTLLEELLASGFQQGDIYMLGFSQGACLMLEFAARNARKFGGLFAYSGGLIGKTLNKATYKGNFQHTPVFLGCSDVDTHIPLHRVRDSADLLRNMGALVTEKIYQGMGHTINNDELDIVSSILKGVSLNLN